MYELHKYLLQEITKAYPDMKLFMLYSAGQTDFLRVNFFKVLKLFDKYTIYTYICSTNNIQQYFFQFLFDKSISNMNNFLFLTEYDFLSLSVTNSL